MLPLPNMPDITQEQYDTTNAAIERKEKLDETLARYEAEEQKKTEILESGERIDEDDTHMSKKPEEFGLKENLQEGANVIFGALRDEARNIVTAPERISDMLSGEMDRQIQETGEYKLDFDFLPDHQQPITRTKWGNILRGILGYASFAIPVAGVAGKISKGTGIAANIAKGTLASKNIFVAGATQGLVHDVLAENSQEDNILGTLKNGPLKNYYPSFLDPLATNDDDSPVMKTLKNVVESMGVGIIFDGVLEGMKVGVRNLRHTPETDPTNLALRAADDGEVEAQRAISESKVDPVKTEEEYLEGKKQKINASREEQHQEAAIHQLQDDGFRADKNAGLADDHQGNHTSTGDVYTVSKQVKRIQTDYSAERGSTDTLMTTAQAERSANEGGLPADFYKQKAQELLGDRRFQQLMKDLKKKKLDIEQVFKESYDSYQQIVSGRNPQELSPEEFWKRIIESDPFQTGGKDNQLAWAMENVIVADLVNASLFTQLRDLAIGARESMNWADIADIDGPVKAVRDNLILGLYNVKRSRYLISDQFRSLRAQDPASAKKAANEALEGLKETTRNNVDMMMELATKSDDRGFLRAVMEAFSMSNRIENWTDMDTFMKRRLRGGDGDTGSLIRELQGVMINSVLSGPKTPLRAIMGTSTAVFLRPLSQMLGGFAQYVGGGFQDATMMKKSMASVSALVESIPEATQYFFTRLNSYWSGDIHTMKSRFAEYDRMEDQWQLMGQWVDTRGSDGDKAAYRLANIARSANQSNFLTYSTKLMAATDDAFTLMLARARAKELAMTKALDSPAAGAMNDINPSVMREYQNEFYKEIFDPADGSVSDNFLEFAKKEATLTKDLSGFAQALDNLFEKQPLLKPFYLFARTGINGLELSMKHVPGFNFLVKEFNDIARAQPDDLTAVMKYGIENAQDLANAKALQNGRLMLGGSVITMASMHYLSGNLTGNGPRDYSTRKTWEDAGWVPRSIKLGDVWISYDSMEPFSNILASVADLGDNQRLMGDEFVEKGLLANALILGKGMISKTYLQGMQQLVDLFGNDPKKWGKLAANLANNTLPLSSLRNEIGRVITPYTRELQSGFFDSIRNRNLATEQLTTDPLPIKYDILTGNPIKDWDVPTRLFNAISPINFNMDQTEGRKFLFRSNYDMRLSTTSAPDGTNLTSSPSVRSKFQRAIGLQGLDKKLEAISRNPLAIISMKQMEDDLRRNGGRGIDPMKYKHNQLIHLAFTAARREAWASLREDPEVYALKKAERLTNAAMNNLNTDRTRSQSQLDAAQELLNMVNR